MNIIQMLEDLAKDLREKRPDSIDSDIDKVVKITFEYCADLLEARIRVIKFFMIDTDEQPNYSHNEAVQLAKKIDFPTKFK